MDKHGINILIVEDEPLISKDIQNKLTALGYGKTTIVDNGFDAINHIELNCPDLVLMDIVLPGSMDGIQTNLAIQQTHNIPVIYLTAYSDQDFLDRAKITDPMAYIIKPATIKGSIKGSASLFFSSKLGIVALWLDYPE